jgi:hypothetical protein
MAPKMNRFWEGYVMGLFHAGFSYSMIVKQCVAHGMSVSKATVSSLVKRTSGTALPPPTSPTKATRRRPCTKMTPSVLRTVRGMALQENPPTQRDMAKRVGVSQSTVHTAIRRRLRLRKFHKAKGHVLLPRHRAERRTNCRRLYERHLAGDRYQYVATLDEAWVYLSNCGKVRAIAYRPSDERGRSTFIRECHESFPKGFMVVAGYTYRGKLNIRRIDSNAKVNAVYYQERILTPIYTAELPALYGRDALRVRVHQDKASSHTAKSTIAFFQRMEVETGIHTIPFHDIPVKSPDASPMDYCGFGLLKRRLGSRRPRTLAGLWKTCQEEWDRIPLPTLQRSLMQWKLRCRAIVREAGGHIEHNRWWRRGFS